MEKEYAEAYSRYEQAHWWFRGRRRILQRLLERHLPDTARGALEIGVGPGINLYALYPYHLAVTGVEPDEGLAQLAARRGPVPVYTGTAEDLPEEVASRQFDLITLFDVLEHIEDDRNALRALRRLLNPAGRLMLTVPAYQWMWGPQDIVNHHFRRYTRKRLRETLHAGGYEVLSDTYFNTLLFPAVAAIRLLAKARRPTGPNLKSDFEYRFGALERLFERVFASEAAWLPHRSFPFGVSLFAVSAPRDTP